MTDEINFIQLKERIALCKDFTPTERDLILAALNLGDRQADQYAYPLNHGPGSSPWATASWAILDQLKPDALTIRDRYMIGGMIAGALSEMYERGRAGKKPR